MTGHVIEPLGSGHDRAAFSCGNPALDRFLKQSAGQYDRAGVGRTYVAVAAAGDRVTGFYTIAAGALDLARLPPALLKRRPRHPVPVVLVGRLAVDTSAQGQGLGARLLAHALGVSLGVADQIGAFAVTVDAADANAARFYERHGFVALADQSAGLVLPIATLRKALPVPPPTPPAA